MKAFVQYMLLYIVENMGLILFDPIFFLILIYSVMVYKRQLDQIEGPQQLRNVLFKMLPDIGIGITIGVCTSGVLAYLGIYFHVNMNILLLIPIAVILMFISPKWGCFSYVVPVAYMVEGLSKLFNIRLYSLDYEMLIYLVGVLHMVEGILVIVGGHINAKMTPIYKDHKLTHCHIMHHIWTVPLIFIVEPGGMALPLYALLAYGDEAKVRTPKQQTLLTGCLILAFGSIIFVLAACIQASLLQTGGVILLMPILHEFIFVVESFMNKGR